MKKLSFIKATTLSMLALVVSIENSLFAPNKGFGFGVSEEEFGKALHFIYQEMHHIANDDCKIISDNLWKILMLTSQKEFVTKLQADLAKDQNDFTMLSLEQEASFDEKKSKKLFAKIDKVTSKMVEDGKKLGQQKPLEAIMLNLGKCIRDIEEVVDKYPNISAMYRNFKEQDLKNEQDLQDGPKKRLQMKELVTAQTKFKREEVLAVKAYLEKLSESKATK